MKPHEDTKPDTSRTRARRELLLLRAGARVLAVFADETEGVAEGLKPAPLPHAPRAVLGVVCVRGRMFTALDPTALASAETGDEGADAAAQGEGVSQRKTPRTFVALAGDEQLALAVDKVEGPVEVNAGALNAAAPASDDSALPLLATLEHAGARVLVLDASKLFDASTRGSERRRQRIVDGEP
jgi:chemotaxis signal transduction protein